MRTTIQISLLALVLVACGSDRDRQPQVEIEGPVTQSQIDSIVGQFTFLYETPLLPDSGSHALIPMNIQGERGGSRMKLSSSYEYDGSYVPRSWNVLFLDLKDNSTYLLTEKKVRVDGIHLHNRLQGLLLSKHVLYTLVESDTNGDGKFDHGDASHLYISGLDGSGLTAISPLEEDLIGWDVINGRDKLVVRTRVDSNADHKFDVDEDIHVYVYDVASRQLEKVISPELQGKVNKLFFEQWLQKVK